MSIHNFALAASFADRASAEAAVARLAVACLPGHVVIAEPIAGLPAAFNVLVPAPLVGLAVDVLDPAAGAFAALSDPRRPAAQRPRQLAHALAAVIVTVMATGAVYWRVTGAPALHRSSGQTAPLQHVDGRPGEVGHATFADAGVHRTR